MKFNSLTRNVRYSFLVLALIAHNSMRPDANQQKIVGIFQEFIDPTRNPHKKFHVYAQEIIAVLRTNPTYTPVCTTLQDLVNKKCTNPVEFLLKFKRHEALLPHEIRKMFEQTSSEKKQQMINVFRKRLTA